MSTSFIGYNVGWRKRLSTAHQVSTKQLHQLHLDFGRFTAIEVNRFMEHSQLPKPNFVCSHGHTVFHDPRNGITIQIGDGEIIANETGITTVSDFRSLDVSLGGQGAPLVPIGDDLLFSEFEVCLNLGGFSNISFNENDERRAFDICPVNIIFNPIANQLGKDYDQNGTLSRSGKLNNELLTALNQLSVYSGSNRPSLAREWLEKEFIPLIQSSRIPLKDKLRTTVEHAAVQISSVINDVAENGRVLVTGGGAKNGFLIERISSLSKAEIVIPETQIVDFKEALIFAFLGVLRTRNETNVLRSVTGASRDSSSGTIHSQASI